MMRIGQNMGVPRSTDEANQWTRKDYREYSRHRDATGSSEPTAGPCIPLGGIEEVRKLPSDSFFEIPPPTAVLQEVNNTEVN